MSARRRRQHRDFEYTVKRRANALLFCDVLFQNVGGRFVLWPIAAAAVGAVSSVMQLEGAVNLPATVLYPLITGGTLVFSTLTGWLVLHERPTPRLLVGMALCVVGTCLFL